MSKHIKGPWKCDARIETVGLNQLPYNGLIYKWTGKTHNIKGIGVPSIIIKNEIGAEKLVEALVNVNFNSDIIAAAPEMLEALENVLALEKAFKTQRRIPGLESLIAKAEGRSS